MPALPILCTNTEHGARLTAALPPGGPGAWCSLRLRLAEPGPWWAKLSLHDEARGQIVREVFLGPLRRHTRATLVHVPAEARDLAIDLFAATPAGAELRLRVLTRTEAALRLAWHGASVLPRALAGSPLGVLGRIRALIGQAPARAGQAPPYATWIALFERPPDAPALQAARAWDAQIAVIAGAPAAIAASLAAASAQLPDAMQACVIADARDWAGLSAAWIVLLQAGEILAPNARAAFAAAASFCPWAEVLTADCDTLSADGTRRDPLFKPGPGPLLSRSPLSAHGAVAVRRSRMTASSPLEAQAARALLIGAAAGRIAHVAAVLSHVPAQPVLTGKAAPAPAEAPSVTILIPSAARAGHVARCVRLVALGTSYTNVTIRLVLAAPERARAGMLKPLLRLPHVTALQLDVQPFNYARVNNQAAQHCNSDMLLLMNDDVAPIDRGWLHAMVAHMADPRVGIVGARLSYGNGMVQHEGVIMGLANLCEHAGRLRDARDPGPHGIGLIDREVSAVTGACLLIRSCLYRELGGMDEAYAIALNDVDLCLRAREAGWRVVYCAGAALHHYESLSLGRHYGGGRAGLESVEVQRLRARHASVIGADPFYNPLASLQPGREWQPAFPPRPHPPAIGAPNL